MKNEKDILKITEKISQNEIKKFRHNCKNNNNIDEYLYKISAKIFKKLVFPYFRFEILMKLVEDSINRNKYYPNIGEKDMKKLKFMLKQLQKICLYLNIVLEEFYKIVLYTGK